MLCQPGSSRQWGSRSTDRRPRQAADRLSRTGPTSRGSSAWNEGSLDRSRPARHWRGDATGGRARRASPRRTRRAARRLPRPSEPQPSGLIPDDVVKEHLWRLREANISSPSHRPGGSPSPANPTPLVNTTGCAGPGSAVMAPVRAASGITSIPTRTGDRVRPELPAHRLGIGREADQELEWRDRERARRNDDVSPQFPDRSGCPVPRRWAARELT